MCRRALFRGQRYSARNPAQGCRTVAERSRAADRRGKPSPDLGFLPKSDQGAAWRMGLNGFRTSSQSNFPDRVSSENWASLVLGREWRTELQQGAFIYGGIDSRGIFRQSHSEATQFNDLGNPITSITDATEYGGSVGGICGFGWRFQDRIAIYTEALLNAQYTRTDRTFSVNGSITTLENKNNLKIVPMVPIALFLTIKF